MEYREQLLEAIAFNNKISAIVVIVDKETDFHGQFGILIKSEASTIKIAKSRLREYEDVALNFEKILELIQAWPTRKKGPLLLDLSDWKI